VDLSKYGARIKEACREVTSAKTETNWALFGYEGQTNTLNLMSQGEDGLEELVEDFNPSKIQYAFLQVECPKTSLPKFVLINWQGETAPGSRKGTCAMHLRAIEQFLPGHHLTFCVRTEDELDLEAILQKVSKVTASAYNFKEKPTGMEHSPAPVGTAHKKINPAAELPDAGARERFWEADQASEAGRVVAERERRQREATEAEEARRAREEVERRAREEREAAREAEQRKAGQRTGKINGEQKESQAAWEEQRKQDAVDAEERAGRGEAARRDRAREAAQLIAGRGGEARAVFQRHSSQGQMARPPQLRKSIDKAPINPKPAPSPAPVATPAPVPITAPAPVSTPFPVPTPAPNQIIAPETTPEPVLAPPLVVEGASQPEPVSSLGDIAPPPPAFESSPGGGGEAGELHHAAPATVAEPAPALDSYGVCAVALYDYQASDETEISFDPGQIISHIDQIDPGWWQGLGPTGTYGLFPANYVEIIDNEELQIM